MELAQKKCSTYKPGTPPITRKETVELIKEVPGWTLEDGHLKRKFEFDDSEASIEFINEIIVLSKEEGHIPDFALREGKFVEIGLYTYPAGGLTMNDFIMAAKINVKRPE